MLFCGSMSQATDKVSTSLKFKFAIFILFLFQLKFDQLHFMKELHPDSQEKHHQSLTEMLKKKNFPLINIKKDVKAIKCEKEVEVMDNFGMTSYEKLKALKLTEWYMKDYETKGHEHVAKNIRKGLDELFGGFWTVMVGQNYYASTTLGVKTLFLYVPSYMLFVGIMKHQ